AGVGAKDAVRTGSTQSGQMRWQPGLAAGLNVRAHAGAAQLVGEDRLDLPALQVSNQGQGQLTMGRSHRDPQDIPTDDVRLTRRSGPAAVGVDGRLAILLDEEGHAKRPVLG